MKVCQEGWSKPFSNAADKMKKILRLTTGFCTLEVTDDLDWCRFSEITGAKT